MGMDKKEIAAIFEEIADLLELKGENPFRARAYRRAARVLLTMNKDFQKAVEEGTLTELEGIGKDLSEKITLLARDKRLPLYQKLKKSVPSGVIEMTLIHGLGPKRAKTLYEKLHIKSIAALKKACLRGEVAKLPGFSSKMEKNILDAMAHREKYLQRHLWWEAMEIAMPILNGLRKLKGVKKAEIAGSLRRKLETIGDLDFLVAAKDPAPVMKWFTKQPNVERILATGETKSTVRLQSGIQADLRVVPEEQFGFAWHHFTGSKEHNVALRQRALAQGWSLSEWGLTAEDRKHPVPKKIVTETDLFKAFGMPYIPPELRENLGELEAAEEGKLPTLVEEKDIRGTFHNHTTASDGRNALQEMVSAAQKLGWEYIGIADHSKSSFQANGLNEESLLKQIEEIRRLNASKKFRIHIFAGTECDILPSGKLDFSDNLLKKLDYVVVSIHSALSQDEKTVTKRLIRAIENPYTTMVGHLTGRLLLRREPYALNIPKVIDACIANKKIIELNANPQRLDMDWRLWHAASEKGLLCCINTDAHSTQNLDFFRAGINIARKGWLEKKHILNTRPLKQVQKILSAH
jgi:DNA polymerase (family 10)